MAISRSSVTPQFVEYVTKYALIDPATNSAPHALVHLAPNAIRIPTFQRGIAWGTEEVMDFLQSPSALLGHVIFATLQQNPYSDLVDGLQRFATGTALLTSLFPLVLQDNPEYPGHEGLFADLIAHARLFEPVFQHNHHQLLNHRRDAIKDQYRSFYQELDATLKRQMSAAFAAGLADVITRCFLRRHVAIDNFSGFNSISDAINTFIGINTIRVELGTVDLFRTNIIEHAEAYPAAWPSPTIESAENHITDTFVNEGVVRKEILPIATACLAVIQAGAPTTLFEHWGTGSNIYELDVFLEFIDTAAAGTARNAYVHEIASCGALPFSVLVLHYYSVYMKTTVNPPYVNGSNADDADLRLFLRAAYRCVMAGTVGQLGPIAERAAKGSYGTLADVANDISHLAGAGPLDQPTAAGWVRAQLISVNKEKAKRVFNACLLPSLAGGQGPFVPLSFGRGADEWHIDQLIPPNQLDRNLPGYAEAARIANFAPLPNQFSRQAKADSCVTKLSAAGIYPTLPPPTLAAHPYLSWLNQNIPVPPAQLDNQALLQPNSNPAIGDQRLNYLEGFPP